MTAVRQVKAYSNDDRNLKPIVCPVFIHASGNGAVNMLTAQAAGEPERR